MEPRLHEIVVRLAGVGFQTMLAVHALLVVSACWLAVARGRLATTAAWVAVIACSLVWFGVNNTWEGRILHEFSRKHGLTQADLVVPATVAIALAVRYLRGRRGKPLRK